MKKAQMMGKIQYAGYLLIIMQGLILALLAVFFLNQQYMAVWRTYPNSETSMTVYLKNVPAENQQNTQDYLLSAADEQSLFIVRRVSLLDNSGNTSGYKFGVYGDVDAQSAELSFMGKKVLSTSDLRELLTSDNLNSTLGVETGSIYSIGNIPTFRFYERIVLQKLPALFNDSQTVNGTYKVLGLDNQAAQSAFLTGLSEASGLPEEDFLEADSGSATNNMVLRDVLLAFLAAQIFLNTVFFLVVVMKNMPKQGKLVLLGWSRSTFAKEILGRFISFSIIVAPILVLANGIIAGWGKLSVALFACYLLAALINVLTVVVELLISASVIMLTKPLDSIRGRIPKKTLYALGVFAYLMISAGLLFCGAYIDQPMASLSNNARLAQRWESVSEYQVLSDISVGEDSDSFSGASKNLDQDLYNWYSSIADTPGVYLIHTQYYDSEILTTWQSNQTYSSIPSEPLWLFTASPNYLADLGVVIDPDVLSAAESGVRVYLIPSELSVEEKNHISEWLQERDTKSLSDGDIQTAFTQNPTFNFVEYNTNQKFFTWSTDERENTETADPIIYIATPQNMRYTETESLKATGFNGYIKFTDVQIADICMRTDMISEFNLLDNNLIFTDVHNYIDGLQKELSATLMWFGLVFLMLMLILVGLLVTLAAVFRIANQEKINVKKFMGFSFLQMYGRPMLLLSALTVLEIATMLLLGSKFGLLLVVIVSLVQIIIFVKYMAHNELKNVLAAFKGE